MTGYGAITLIPAWNNYQNAKKNLEYWEERKAGIEAAVAAYNFSKYDVLYNDDFETKQYDPLPSGINYTTLLRVGNLAGNLGRVHNSVWLSNSGSQPVMIYKVFADSTILDCPVLVFPFSSDAQPIEQSKQVSRIIKPGETMEIFLPSGIFGLANKETGESTMGDLRDLICQAATEIEGEPVSRITQCPKLNIEGGQTADIMIEWYNVDENGKGAVGEKKVSVLMNRKGVLRYCGEAYLPSDN